MLLGRNASGIFQRLGCAALGGKIGVFNSVIYCPVLFRNLYLIGISQLNYS
jgi:hypothetical protein